MHRPADNDRALARFHQRRRINAAGVCARPKVYGGASASHFRRLYPASAAYLFWNLPSFSGVASGDLAFESHGARLINPPWMAIIPAANIDGTELDYVREGLQEGFRFNNAR